MEFDDICLILIIFMIPLALIFSSYIPVIFQILFLILMLIYEKFSNGR